LYKAGSAHKMGESSTILGLSWHPKCMEKKPGTMNVPYGGF